MTYRLQLIVTKFDNIWLAASRKYYITTTDNHIRNWIRRRGIHGKTPRETVNCNYTPCPGKKWLLSENVQIDFKNTFTDRFTWKLPMYLSWRFPPHLNYVRCYTTLWNLTRSSADTEGPRDAPQIRKNHTWKGLHSGHSRSSQFLLLDRSYITY